MTKSNRYTLKLNRRITQLKDSERILGTVWARLKTDLQQAMVERSSLSYDPAAGMVRTRPLIEKPSKRGDVVRYLQFVILED
jgi:hypothetical protein